MRAGPPRVREGAPRRAARHTPPGPQLRVMDRDDVWMRESRDRTRFPMKARQRVGIRHQPRGQYLDRDIPEESGIPRSIHFAHATGAEGGEDFIRAKAGSGGKGHGSMRDYKTPASRVCGTVLITAQGYRRSPTLAYPECQTTIEGNRGRRPLRTVTIEE